MTAQELLSNYAKAENAFFTATETIRKNKEILIKDFEEKNPGYYIKALCKTLEDYENKCGDAEIDFVIDGKVYTPATFECNLDDKGNVWGLVINLELED